MLGGFRVERRKEPQGRNRSDWSLGGKPKRISCALSLNLQCRETAHDGWLGLSGVGFSGNGWMGERGGWVIDCKQYMGRNWRQKPASPVMCWKDSCGRVLWWYCPGGGYRESFRFHMESGAQGGKAYEEVSSKVSWWGRREGKWPKFVDEDAGGAGRWASYVRWERGRGLEGVWSEANFSFRVGKKSNASIHAVSLSLWKCDWYPQPGHQRAPGALSGLEGVWSTEANLSFRVGKNVKFTPHTWYLHSYPTVFTSYQMSNWDHKKFQRLMAAKIFMQP